MAHGKESACQSRRCQRRGFDPWVGNVQPIENGKEMTSHFSILAWKIPCIEELGGLQSMESQRVGHD